ncbi:hypothetical protein M9H77_07685 [Catharanthus roseus]|uniref:Uncharacterized protein n=1 Tax=Catharanthus roseus TaxID=4058 RepID=A0ACC0BVP5_CATRO|nr:hypothetical protein M9H77_07685 [Catharanthus roseus]
MHNLAPITVTGNMGREFCQFSLPRPGTNREPSPGDPAVRAWQGSLDSGCSRHLVPWATRLGAMDGLEIKAGLKTELVGAPGYVAWFYVKWRMRWLWNPALVRCLDGTDYEMPELIPDDLIMGSGLCPWSPTFALHVLLNSSVEATLILVPRGTLVPYSAAVNLVEGLGVLHHEDEDEGEDDNLSSLSRIEIISKKTIMVTFHLHNRKVTKELDLQLIKSSIHHPKDICPKEGLDYHCNQAPLAHPNLRIYYCDE